MTTGNAPTHTCSYFCDKPECIKAQRDELRDKLAALESQPVPVEPVAQYEGVEMSRYTISWLNSPPLNLENLHTIYDESNPWPHIPVGTKLYLQSAIDSLQSALQRAQEERDRHMGAVKAYIEDADAMKQRAEKAEAILIQHYCDYEFKPTLEQAAEMMLEERNEKKALEAENAALAEVVEPVAWMHRSLTHPQYDGGIHPEKRDGWEHVPLYSSPVSGLRAGMLQAAFMVKDHYWDSLRKDQVVKAHIEGIVKAITKAADQAADTAPASQWRRVEDGFRLSADGVQWVVNNIAELGVKIGNQFFFLYKGHSLVYENPINDDDGTPMMWRPVGKREFGECCHPINYSDLTKIGTVSLTDSDEWMPLPALPEADK